MLLGGDLKFLFSVVVVVVGWLVARWKWRRAATRREEISRLMAFASEEAARAELEAAASYKNYAPEPVAVELAGPLPGGRQFQYHCEVCFSPTTTRCKQCKAVRYCSRKCQILHWRQGHKDECHSLTTSENIDVGVHSYVKEPEQDGTRQNAVKIEVLHTIKPDESTPETCTFSNSNFYELGENADIETEVSDNSKITDLNVKTPVHSLPDECSSSPISIQMPVTFDRHNGHRTFMDAKSRMPHTTEKPSLTSHGFCRAASSASNELQFGRNVAGEKSESSKSGFSPTGSEDYSLSKSSSPSSGFWAGTVEHMRSKINALDEVDDVDMSKSCSSSPPSSLVNSPVEMLGSGMNKVMEDNSYPAATMPKKSIALLEVNEYGLDSREPLSLSSKLPGLCGDGNTSSCCRSMGETKLSSSDACHGGTSERHVPSTSVVDVSCLQSLAPKKLNNETDRTNGILDTSKFQQNDSSRLLKTESHLCSSANTRNPAIQVLQSVETERTHDNASRSLDSSSYLQSATTGTKAMTRIVDQLRVSNVIRHDSLGAGSGTMGRYEGSFPYELFVKLYNWNKIELSPCGLINCGNSCYANAVLQCLAFTPPLAAYCLQGLHAKICKKKEWCFTCGFEELVEKAKESNNPLSPARILSQMQRMGSHLGNGKEEDAHEFLRYAIDAMQSVCLKEAEANVPSYLIEATTLLGLTFGGYLQSKIECMRCGGKSKQHERIMDLSVEIGGEIGSLEDALLQFTHSEILDGENKYHCGRCKSYEKAKKKLRVLEAPNVLVVALKRFQTGKFGKLNKAVKFPEILNLAPYMSGTSDKSPIYQLYGVLVHLDVMNAVFSGHYVCYIKNNQGRWFKADDSVVQAVGLEKVLSSDAYILFYARCSPRAPRVLRSLVGPRDPRKSKNLSSKAKSQPWDVPVGPTTSGYFDSFHTRRSNAEEESSSEYSSSYFSSEAGSHSTESSNRESVSTTDLDHCSSDAESSSCSSVNMSPKINGDGFRAKDEAFARGTSLCRSNKEGSRVGGYSSRETRKQ